MTKVVEMAVDKNCLSYWFPKLVEAGVPVPRTEIVTAEIDLIPLCDGITPEGFGRFTDRLVAAAKTIGSPPYFLRTGHGSGKHQWKNTCYWKDVSKVARNVYHLVTWSYTVDIIGLPVSTWVVREMLPVEPIALLPMYGNMPLATEARCFIQHGNIRCIHPYWPAGAIEHGLDPRDPGRVSEAMKLYNTVCQWPHRMHKRLRKIVSTVGEAFRHDGSWSVDVLLTKRGWVVTDMALAARSFHWETCQQKST